MYIPGQFDGQNVGLYLQEELQRISEAITPLDDGQIDLRYAAPEKPRSGLYFADGTDWDPGSGKGSYRYDETLQTYVFLEHPAGVLVETDPTVPAHVKAITTLQVSNWDTAYGWGDHSIAGYLTSYTETDPLAVKLAGANQALLGTYRSTNNANLDGANFSVDTTSKSTAEYAYEVLRSGVTVGGFFIDGRANIDGTTVDSTAIGNWNTAFGWGNHATAGYLSAEVDTLSSVTGRGAETSTAMIVNIGSGGSGFYLDSTASWVSGTLYGPGLRWREADGTSIAGIRGYVGSSGTNNLVLGRGWLNNDFIIGNEITSALIINAPGGNSTNWNTAYGWGDHALGGYLPTASPTFTGTLSGPLHLADELRTLGGNYLIINAGESHTVATGQTNELVYINAEAGLQINSSPDNWGTGWAGRNTVTLCDTAGNSNFPTISVGNITTSGDLIHSPAYLDVRRTAAGSCGVRVLNSASAIQGYLYSDGAQTFGLLHSGGGWAVQIAPASNTVTFPGNVNVNSGLDVTGNITVTGTVDTVDLLAFYNDMRLSGEFSATYAANIKQFNRWGANQDMGGTTNWDVGVYGGYNTMTNGPTGMTYDPFIVMGSSSDVRSFLVVPRTASRALAYKGSSGSGTSHTAWHYSGWTTNAADAQLSLYAKLASPTFTGNIIVNNGKINAGTGAATAGQIIIEGDYSSANVLNVFGSLRSSGASMLGFAVEPSTTVNDGYVSSAGNAAFARTAFECRGGDFSWKRANSATVAKGTAVTMTEVMALNATALEIQGNVLARNAHGVYAYSAGNDKYVAILHNDTYGRLVCPTGDGDMQLEAHGQAQIILQDQDALGNTSGATVKSHGATHYDIGYNQLPDFNWNVTDVLEARHCGAITGHSTNTQTANHTITLAGSTDLDFPVDGVTTIMNGDDTYDIIVNEGSLTTLYFNEPGSGLVDTTGGITIGPGGTVTIRRESTTVYHCWGSEVTYTP